MMCSRLLTTLISVFCLGWMPAIVMADFDIVFSEGDQLDGDMVGGTANFSDPDTGIDAVLTSTIGHSGMTIDTGPGFLALGPLNPMLWSTGESWGFQWDVPTLVQSISFNQLDNSEFIFMQCDDWIGKGFVPGDVDRVWFDDSTGTFELDRGFLGGGLQTWTVDDLTGGVPLQVSPESNVTFSLADFTTVVMTGMSWTALPRFVTAESFNAVLGNHSGGTLEDTFESDDLYLCHLRGAAFSPVLPSIILELAGTLPTDSPNGLTIVIESRVNDLGIDQEIKMFNFDTGSFELVDTRDATRNVDGVTEVSLTGDINRFVEAGTGAVKTQVNYKDDGTGFFINWSACIDQFGWKLQ